MAKIQTIKNKDNTIVYPQTHTQAVYDANGKKLQEWMNEYLTAEDETEIENANTFFEIQGNKTTILDNNSTNIQYPAAKTVYDFVTQSIGEAISLKIEVVDLLPDAGEDSTIYLVSSEDSEEQNVYNEYLYLNNEWELIGTTKVDLSNYVTKDELIPWLTAVPSSIDDLELGIYRIDTLSIEGNAATFPVTNGAINLHTMFNGCNCVYLYVSQDSKKGKTAILQGTSNINNTITPKIVAYYSGGSDSVLYENQAEGQFAKLSKYGDTTINIGRKASTTIGENSIAEGYNVTANGRYSHAEGNATIANDQAAHAEGQQTIAWGPASHTEGDNTRANGQAGHAEGYHTISEFMSQHVQGEYNIADPGSGTDVRGTYAHIVGNGAGDIYRSNAHTLDWYGNAWFEGNVYVGSTSGTNKDDGSKKLATEEYVNNMLENNNNETTIIYYSNNESSINLIHNTEIRIPSSNTNVSFDPTVPHYVLDTYDEFDPTKEFIAGLVFQTGSTQRKLNMSLLLTSEMTIFINGDVPETDGENGMYTYILEPNYIYNFIFWFDGFHCNITVKKV